MADEKKPAWEIPVVDERAEFVPVAPAAAEPPSIPQPMVAPTFADPASAFAPPVAPPLPPLPPTGAPVDAVPPVSSVATPAAGIPGLKSPAELMAMAAPTAPRPTAATPDLSSFPAPTMNPGTVPLPPGAMTPPAMPAPAMPAMSAPDAAPPAPPAGAPLLAAAPAPGAAALGLPAAPAVVPAPPSGPGELAVNAAPIADGDVISALEQVLFAGASDLHVTANSMPMLRVDGRLRPVPGAGLWSQAHVEAAVRGLMTDEQQSAFDTDHELDFAYALPGGTRFRVNCYQQRGATGAAFRIISTTIRSLEELGLPDIVAQFATLPRGLVLVTGPTGSGKSTTLAALIDLVNRTRYDHIVTVEDPIEYVHANKRALINQREVGSDTHSFSAALKHVLRQDPDVILVGEMRDLETISVALTAAETGHLVFATLHTQDAAQTIDRIIDVYPAHQQDQIRTQLAATLQGVVSQTLVPRAAGAGRVIATEVLITTPAISNLIREGKAHQITSSMQAGRALGMHTMDQHLADLVNEGEITREAAFEKAHDPDSLERLIRREDMSGADMTFDPSAFNVAEPVRKH
ncbi:MAG TPA: type IV pilus twitching motility protein PilT [Pseudolysinimonas sp.]|nr:type IV pilus twitching motility protein PilT [Pseudolysinimonas sp.]